MLARWKTWTVQTIHVVARIEPWQDLSFTSNPKLSDQMAHGKITLVKFLCALKAIHCSVAVKFIRLELALIDEVVGRKFAEAFHPAMNKIAVIVPLAAFLVFTGKNDAAIAVGAVLGIAVIGTRRKNVVTSLRGVCVGCDVTTVTRDVLFDLYVRACGQSSHAGQHQRNYDCQSELKHRVHSYAGVM
jgi:hypothetical protein